MIQQEVTNAKSRSSACHAVTTKQFRADSVWNSSGVIQLGRIPNLQLIKVTEMIGYDETSKPTPGARVEQKFR